MSNELQEHMKRQLANQHNHKPLSSGQQDNKNPAALGVMDDLFIRLKAVTVVGNAFKTPSEEAIVKQEWMLGFREEGVTKQSMIDDGLDAIRIKARKSSAVTYFPTLGEFIDACKGNNNSLELAKRGLDLFNSGQKQIDSVGQMVVSKHGFDLKKMKAADNNKQFIELYLGYAANNPIEAKESHLLTETVQLSEEQQKDADNRALIAQNQFLNKFKAEIAKEVKVEPMKHENVGVKTGSLKVYKKTPIQKEDEKQRQLKIAKGMCK